MALKVVLDTDVLISGLIVSSGPSGRILDAVQGRVVVSNIAACVARI